MSVARLEVDDDPLSAFSKAAEEEHKPSNGKGPRKTSLNWEEENNPFAGATAATPSNNTSPGLGTSDKKKLTKPAPAVSRPAASSASSSGSVEAPTPPRRQRSAPGRSGSLGADGKKKATRLPLPEIQMLSGETANMNLHIGDCDFLVRSRGKEKRLAGKFIMTTYQIIFQPAEPTTIPLAFFKVPLGTISRIQDYGTVTAGQPSLRIQISTKDARTLVFGFVGERLVRSTKQALEVFVFPPKMSYTFAFTHRTQVDADRKAAAGAADVADPESLSARYHFEFRREYERFGAFACGKYKLTEINKDFKYSPTYPPLMVVPKKITMSILKDVAKFRSKARIPIMCWCANGPTCPKGGGKDDGRPAMWRCSQPKVGIQNNRSRGDEILLDEIRKSAVHARQRDKRLLIVDCRGRAAAYGNKVKGWGFEDPVHYLQSEVSFKDIGNIHTVRGAYKALTTLINSSSTSNDSQWLKAMENTNWPYVLRQILQASISVAYSIYALGRSVVVHCSDGWDRTAQVCSLSQLMLDPYYRTLDGFCVLCQKEWILFGHKFHDRLGHADKDHSDSDRSPVFLQYLECVFQLQTQYPTVFEFNADLLLGIADHLYSLRFGTFLYNNEKERRDSELREKTPSLWAFLCSPEKRGTFLNPMYKAHQSVLIPSARSCCRMYTPWNEYFLRWQPASIPSAIFVDRSTQAPTAYTLPLGFVKRALVDATRQLADGAADNDARGAGDGESKEGVDDDGAEKVKEKSAQEKSARALLGMDKPLEVEEAASEASSSHQTEELAAARAQVAQLKKELAALKQAAAVKSNGANNGVEGGDSKGAATNDAGAEEGS